VLPATLPSPSSPSPVLHDLNLRVRKLDAGGGTWYYVGHADDKEGYEERDAEEGGRETRPGVQVGGHGR